MASCDSQGDGQRFKLREICHDPASSRNLEHNINSWSRGHKEMHLFYCGTSEILTLLTLWATWKSEVTPTPSNYCYLTVLKHVKMVVIDDSYYFFLHKKTQKHNGKDENIFKQYSKEK